MKKILKIAGLIVVAPLSVLCFCVIVGVAVLQVVGLVEDPIRKMKCGCGR